MHKRLVIASDHGGLELKNTVKDWLVSQTVDVIDLGTHNDSSVDYTDYAHKLAEDVLSNEGTIGILICGTGLGMSLAANRHVGIRAALCADTYTARMAKQHNDANILCMGGRVVGPGVALEIVQTFLNTHFEGGRHVRRINQIELTSK